MHLFLSPRRLLSLLLCSVLWLSLLSSPAAAATFSTEQDLIDATSFADRDGFVFYGTAGEAISRDTLRNLDTFYDSVGFDRNFLTWEPQTTLNPNSTLQWAGCTSRGTTQLGICPGAIDFFDVRDSIANGPVTIIGSLGAFIGVGCGNYSASGAAGSTPSISGVKYEDRNANGRRDAGEPGLSGWTIRLFFEDQLVTSLQTGPGGAYSFDLDANSLTAGGQPIGAGTYRVVEVQQSGWMAAQTPTAIEIPYGVGNRSYVGRDFGNFRNAQLSGHKVEDLDADGVDGADPGLPEWEIQLVDGTNVLDDDTTGTDGGYNFSVRPGTYTLTEVNQPGWVQSAPDGGSHTLTVHSGDVIDNLDFGNYRPARIDGRKFNDVDVDGTGTGDDGLPDWAIRLDGSQDQMTAADGSYRFDGLTPGTYVVSEVQQDGWRQTGPASGVHTVSVRSGDVVSNVDFGNVCLGEAAIDVVDVQGGRDGLGVEILLDEVSVPGILANVPPLPRTGIDDAIFDDLLPGTYRMTAFLPDDVFTDETDVTVVDGRFAIVKEITIQPCASTSVVMEVFTASDGKVTGGMREPVEGGFATAGFNFQTSPKGEPRGTLQFNDHATGLNLHTRDIDGIRISTDRTVAHVWGIVDVDGTAERFLLRLVDAGEPGRADRFELTLAGGYAAGFEVVSMRGNVQIHKPNGS